MMTYQEWRHEYNSQPLMNEAMAEAAWKAAMSARKPLTEMQIQAICCAVDASGARPAATALIRAVEAAHGIGA